MLAAVRPSLTGSVPRINSSARLSAESDLSELFLADVLEPKALGGTATLTDLSETPQLASSARRMPLHVVA